VTSSREFLAAQLNAAQLLNDTQGLDAARRYLDERRAQYPQQTSPLTRIEVELLASADRQHDAMALLNQALAIESDDHDLLYTRAMLAEQLDDLALLERDLRHLIQLKPDHAEALNALGYTLADRTDRWQEALPLVEKALALSPNNPAIIDSLGWIYFRAGQLDKALPLLQQAYELMVDHEIAAHYGELLWITGEKQRALDIWEEGLESNPDSDIIPETMQRLNASPQ
jgi:tetratricopeptide (TPR) repeat protein